MATADQDQGPRIIVVDDEPELRETVVEYLASQGFISRGVGGGRELDAAHAEEPADLLLIDVHLPQEDGLSIARRMRASSTVPIIMLTAADDIVDRVLGLELGADDYLTKPFDLRELKARIRAVLRRHQFETRPAEAAPAEPRPADGAPPETALAPAESAAQVAFGMVMLDLDSRCLVRADGSCDALTAMEFDLLKVFAENPNRVLSRDRLLDLAHNRDNDPFDRSIDVRITRLRKKIEADPAKPQTIKTVRGVGYLFVPGRKG